MATPLKQKIDDIEKRLDQLDKDQGIDSFTKKMTNIHDNEEKKKKKDAELSLDHVKHQYMETLKSNNLEIKVPDLPKIVEATVLFVEKTWDVMAKIVDVAIDKNTKGTFKLQSAINLITELFEDIDMDLLTNMINQMVDLVINHDKYFEKVEEEKNKRLDRKHSGSIRRAKKIILPFTCHK